MEKKRRGGVRSDAGRKLTGNLRRFRWGYWGYLLERFRKKCALRCCKGRQRSTTKIALQIFTLSCNALPFSLETSRYALVAKALRYKMAFSLFSETDVFCEVEN